jgi:hypothetical protein
MWTKREVLGLGLVLAMVAGGAVPAAAQTNEEINAGLQFNFAPPGARSLGMGGAFIGLADDATAAYANPAGLVWLTRHEVSAEGRGRSYTTTYPYTGSANGRLLGDIQAGQIDSFNLPPNFPPSYLDSYTGSIDTVNGLVTQEFDADTSGLSYFSYAHVLSPRWRVAVYRHELSAFEADLEGQGVFLRDSDADDGIRDQLIDRTRTEALTGVLTLDIDNIGGSVAFKATERFWLGLGLSQYDFSYSAITDRYATNFDIPGSRASLTWPGLVPFGADFVLDRSVQTGDDSDIGLIGGFLWNGEQRRWALGGVYRQGPEFDMDYVYSLGPFGIEQATAIVDDGDGNPNNDRPANPNIDDPGLIAALSGSTTFQVPDSYGIGISFRPRQELVIALEVTEVEYSALTPKANLIRNVVVAANGGNVEDCGSEDADGFAQTPIPCVTGPHFQNFKVDDATEVHLGGEWVFPGRSALAIRLGGWLDPDHQLYYDTGGRSLDEIRAPEDRFPLRFPQGDDEVHVTGGLGISGSRWQLDLAFDTSERADIYSLSTVVRFGG